MEGDCGNGSPMALWAAALKTVAVFDKGDTADESPSAVAGNESGDFNCQLADININSLVVALLWYICQVPELNKTQQKKLFKNLCVGLRVTPTLPLIDNIDGDEVSRVKLFMTSLRNVIQVALSCAKGKKWLLPNPVVLNLSEYPFNIYLQPLRFKSEFSFLSFLGKGGFGTVYKSRHKIDKQDYAVKKIVIRVEVESQVQKMLREVQTIAQLHHPNIVSYKQSWLEPFTSEKSMFKGDVTPDSSTSLSSSQSTHHENGSVSEHSESIIFENSATCIENVDERSQTKCVQIKTVEEESVETMKERRDSKTKQEMQIVTYKSTENVDVADGRFRRRRERSIYDVILYIQMELCESTLQKWIEKRNESRVIDEAVVNNIVQQLLSGVEYIHDRGVVHRDIKPTNIFYNGKKRLKIGDFGLACFVSPENAGFSGIDSFGRISSQVGTHPYAAPEQVAGNLVDKKSDLYSVGIVLLELFHIFSTGMERSAVLTNVRDGHFPEDFVAKWPQQCELIRRLLAADPQKRPTATEALQQWKNICLPSATKISVTDFQELQVQLAEKDRLLQEKDRLLQEKDLMMRENMEEIRRLKELLNRR